MIFSFLYGYALFGIIAAVGGVDILIDYPGDRAIGPPGAEPAIRFLFGVFWPIMVVAGLAYGVWLLSANVAGGFSALWRHWRGHRLPRARTHR